MPRTRLFATAAVAAIVLFCWPFGVSSQIPLSPPRDAGQTVTPAYEGWYPNEDGTFTLSFGYFNRNKEEILEIPVGPNNFIEGAQADLGQPTRFHPQRHWGVFTVKVPADFGTNRLVWTLVNRGQTFAIGGHLDSNWLLDAKLNLASGNTPPVLRFDPSGPQGSGPDGITIGPLETTVGTPLTLTIWITDDEIGRGGGGFRRQTEPIVLLWFKHRGPGDVEFGDTEPAVDRENGGRSTTSATFDAPGSYVLRVRVNDLSGNISGGHAQCCWTNGYVKVDVTGQ